MWPLLPLTGAWFVLRFSISGRDGAEIPSGPCFSNEDGMGYVITIPIEHFRLSIASRSMEIDLDSALVLTLHILPTIVRLSSRPWKYTLKVYLIETKL